jgi:hypothetical protein
MRVAFAVESTNLAVRFLWCNDTVIDLSNAIAPNQLSSISLISAQNRQINFHPLRIEHWIALRCESRFNCGLLTRKATAIGARYGVFIGHSLHSEAEG